MKDFTTDFDKYHSIYEDVLSKIYPSKNNTGFTERNLTNNFEFAYLNVHQEESIAHWFELQFGISNDGHLDGILVNFKKREIIFLEAKRFQTSRKLKDVEDDIQRIEAFDILAEFKDRIPDVYLGEIQCSISASGSRIPDDYLDEPRCPLGDPKHWTFYGLILADVWIAKRGLKKNIYDAFKKGKSTYPYNYYVYDFKNGIKPIITDSYKLLSLIWELHDTSVLNPFVQMLHSFYNSQNPSVSDHEDS